MTAAPPELAAPPPAPVARVDDGAAPPRERSPAWMDEAASSAAAALSSFPPGPVLVRTCDGPAFHAAFLACLRAGRAAVPLTPGTPAGAADATGAVAELVSDGPAETPRAQARSPLFPAEARAAGVLLHTSGSTAAATVAFRSAASLVAVGRACAEALGVTADDHVMTTSALSHSYGLEHGLLMPWAAGCRVTCAAAPRATGAWLLGVVERVRPTVLPAVPSVVERFAQEAGSPAAAAARLRAAGVRLLYSAGGVLPPALAAAFMDGGLPVGQVFGSTEVGSVTWAPPGEDAGVGFPLRGVGLAIDGDGGLLVRSPWAMEGVAGAGFATGDLATLGADDALRLLGRSRLLVSVGGRKVNPAEVEAALAACPGVADAVVVPLVQSETVTRLQAFVEPRDPAEPPRELALRAALRETLAGHKIPRRFHLLSPLPRTDAGKPDRAALQRLADSRP